MNSSIASLVVFSIFALFAPPLWLSSLDGFILLALAILNLYLVVRNKQQLVPRVIAEYYLALVASFAGILWMVARTIGLPGLETLGSVWLRAWQNLENIAYFLGYGLIVLVGISAVAVGIYRAIHSRFPTQSELLDAVLLGTILWIPCDFHLLDIWRGIGVTDSEAVNELPSALALSNLDMPLLLHLLVLVGYTLARSQHRETSGPSKPRS